MNCSKCGAICCRKTPIMLLPSEYDELKFHLEPEVLREIDASQKLYAIIPPCPFLDEHDRCLIYEERPIVCRAFPIMQNNQLSAACPEAYKITPEDIASMLHASIELDMQMKKTMAAVPFAQLCKINEKINQTYKECRK